MPEVLVAYTIPNMLAVPLLKTDTHTAEVFILIQNLDFTMTHITMNSKIIPHSFSTETQEE